MLQIHLPGTPLKMGRWRVWDTWKVHCSSSFIYKLCNEHRLNARHCFWVLGHTVITNTPKLSVAWKNKGLLPSRAEVYCRWLRAPSTLPSSSLWDHQTKPSLLGTAQRKEWGKATGSGTHHRPSHFTDQSRPRDKVGLLQQRIIRPWGEGMDAGKQ